MKAKKKEALSFSLDAEVSYAHGSISGWYPPADAGEFNRATWFLTPSL